MQELKKILEEIRVKAIELKNKHWGDDERHLIGKGIEAMCVQAEQIIRKHMNDGWIPVEESLPEDWESVLCTDGEYIYLVEYDGDLDAGFGDIDGITAWCPLPDPYNPE